MNTKSHSFISIKKGIMFFVFICLYFSGQSIVPAWVFVLFVALAELFCGGLLYILLKICVLDKVPESVGYIPASSVP